MMDTPFEEQVPHDYNLQKLCLSITSEFKVQERYSPALTHTNKLFPEA